MPQIKVISLSKFNFVVMMNETLIKPVAKQNGPFTFICYEQGELLPWPKLGNIEFGIRRQSGDIVVESKRHIQPWLQTPVNMNVGEELRLSGVSKIPAGINFGVKSIWFNKLKLIIKPDPIKPFMSNVILSV